MTVLLNRAYAGYPAGQTVQLSSDVEAALVAQGLASAATLPTSGAATANAMSGRAAIAAGVPSVVITNNLVDAQSKVFAVVAQAAADGTLLRVDRIVPAAGLFTIFGNANATAITYVDWNVAVPAAGMTIRN